MTQNHDVEIGRTIRNGIISVLELWASKEAQLNYQKDVPIANVPAELFCQWCDDSYHKESPIIGKEFSIKEKEALVQFDEIINRISALTPEELPGITEFIETNEWKIINQAAIETLPKIIRPE